MKYIKNIDIYNTERDYDNSPYYYIIKGSYDKEYDDEYLEFRLNTIFTEIFKNIGCHNEFYLKRYIPYIHTFENSSLTNDIMKCIGIDYTIIKDKTIIDKLILLIKNIRYRNYEYKYYFEDVECIGNMNIANYISLVLKKFIKFDMFDANQYLINETNTEFAEDEIKIPQIPPEMNKYEKIMLERFNFKQFEILKNCKANFEKLITLTRQDLYDLENFVTKEINFISTLQQRISTEKRNNHDLTLGVNTEKDDLLLLKYEKCRSFAIATANRLFKLMKELTKIKKIIVKNKNKKEPKAVFNAIYKIYKNRFNLKLYDEEYKDEILKYLKNVNNNLMEINKDFKFIKEKLYIDYKNYTLNFVRKDLKLFKTKRYLFDDDDWFDESEIYYRPNGYSILYNSFLDKRNEPKYFIYTYLIKYYIPKYSDCLNKHVNNIKDYLIDADNIIINVSENDENYEFNYVKNITCKYSLNSEHTINKYFSDIVCESSNLIKYFMTLNEKSELYELNLRDVTNFKFTELLKIENERDYAEFIHLMITYATLDILNDDIKRIFNELMYLQCDEVLEIIQYYSECSIKLFK